MAIVEAFAATHDSGARYTPFKGELKVGDIIRIAGRVDETWVANNRPHQGCIRAEDMDNLPSLKWGTSLYSTADVCGYNVNRRASEGKHIFVFNVKAHPEHVKNGIRIKIRCVNPVDGGAKIVIIPVKKE
jgi:hypothetical protein